MSEYNPGPVAERAFRRARNAGQGDGGDSDVGQPGLRPLPQLALHQKVTFSDIFSTSSSLVVPLASMG